MSASFELVVDRAFRVLADELGLTGPAGVDPAAVSYSGPDVSYTITLDPATGTVSTVVARDLDGVRLTADLPALVRGAALGNPAAVPCGARSLPEMRATVAAQAVYVRRLQPYLTALNAMPLMRAAHARELRSA
ncbi:hypothetical protein [Actinoplanes sp. NPDC026619]|uniref:hypothetical protein n=1 Tax=Actinoplanes sp. NPDC026619 TaxID=3155798 RepID=UPI0033FBE141